MWRSTLFSQFLAVRFNKFFILLFSCLVIASCGGGGGGSTLGSVSAIELTNFSLREYQEGDRFEYDLKLTDVATNDMLFGTLVFEVTGTVQNPFGIDCFGLSFEIRANGQVSAGTILLHQDAEGNLYDCGEDDGALGYDFITDTAQTPDGLSLTYRSEVTVGDTISSRIEYEDGYFETCNKMYTQVDTVRVPVGVYEAVKYELTCNDSDGETTTEEAWVVPGIFDIKSIAESDGVVFEANMTGFTLQ